MKHLKIDGRQDGQSVMEFALIVPFFLMFLLSIIYGGMFMSDYLALKHAANSAAQAATLESNVIEDEDVLKEKTVLMLSDNLSFDVERLKKDDSTDTNFVQVTATAKIVKSKLPTMAQDWFGTEIKSVSAPEYKPD